MQGLALSSAQGWTGALRRHYHCCRSCGSCQAVIWDAGLDWRSRMPLREGCKTSFGASGSPGAPLWANGQELRAIARQLLVTTTPWSCVLGGGHLMLVPPSRGAPWGGYAFRPLSAAGPRVSSPGALSCVRRADTGLASLVLSACRTRLLAALSRGFWLGSCPGWSVRGDSSRRGTGSFDPPPCHRVRDCRRADVCGLTRHIPCPGVVFWTCAVAVRGADGILPPTPFRMGLVWFTRGCIIGLEPGS